MPTSGLAPHTLRGLPFAHPSSRGSLNILGKLSLRVRTIAES